MSFASFLADPRAVEDRGEWLAEFTVPGPAGDVVLRYSRRGTPTGASAITIGPDTLPAHTPFARRLLVAPSMMQALWKARTILGRSIPSYGQVEIENTDGRLDIYKPALGYRWGAGSAKIYFADRLDIQGTIGKIFDGKIGRPDWNVGAPLRVPLFGREADFEAPTSKRVYRGTRYALELNGDRTVAFGSPAAVNITGALTLQGWLWLDALPTGNVTWWGYIASTRLPWRLDLRATGAMQFAYTHSTGTGAAHLTTKLLTTQRWYHFAWTASGTVLTSIIWDEDAQVETIETFTLAAATRDAQSAGSYQLRSGSDATLRVWHDDLDIRNVALTPREIAARRKGPLAPIPASCVHYLKCDDGSGTTVTDSSASGITGTISGAGTSTYLWICEGDETLAGTPKPDHVGEALNAPMLVDPIRFAFQVAGGGSVQSIVPDEGGITHILDANAASFRAFLTTTPAAGHALPHLARGLFRLGSSPTLPVCALVQGYNGGTLGYANTPGGITRKLVTEGTPALADPGGLDTASFTAYGAASTAKTGLFIPQPIPIGQALDTINAGGLGWYGFVRASSQLHVERFSGPAAVADYNFDLRQIVSVTPVTPAAPVVYEVVVRYAYNPVVLTDDQAAATFRGTAGWQARRQDWQEAPRSDETLRGQYPGAGGQSITIDTGLQLAADAYALADAFLALVKGEKEGWIVRLRATGLQLRVGQTVTLTFMLQDGSTRAGLDGTKKYVILSTEDVRQREEVKVEVWG